MNMPVANYEREQYPRAARALQARGAEDLAALLLAVAGAAEVPLEQWDRAAEVYRAWLVFDEPKASKPVEQQCDRERFGDPCHVCDAEERAARNASPSTSHDSSGDADGATSSDNGLQGGAARALPRKRPRRSATRRN